MNNKDIDKVISILKRETKKMHIPIVTEVSRLGRNPFSVLISTVLSLRTKDNVTAKATRQLLTKAPTPEKILTLTEKQIQKLIYPVGFYITKAKNIKKICKKLLDEYNGKVPDDIDTLLTFPGVGRKTANLVLTLGYGKLGLCIDTHCHRIPNRWGLIKTKTPDKTEFALRKILPKKHWIIYNDLLVMWGQNICKPISPFCSRCKIRRYCKRINVKTSR